MSPRQGAVALAVLAWCAGLCGCGGPAPVDLGLDSTQTGETFGLVNRTDSAWSEVRVRVTGDRGPGACFDDVVTGWRPGEVRSFPRCGDRTLVALNVDGQDSYFVVGGSTLYHKLGRREVPVRP